MPQRSLALTWSLSELHGWGLVGLHLCLYLAELGIRPLLLEKPAMGTMRPQNRERLTPLLQGYDLARGLSEKQPPEQVLFLQEFDVLHALSNGFVAQPVSTRFRGVRNIGIIAYEDTRVVGDVLQRAKSYDAMMVHSTFNKQMLEERGVENLLLTFQGVDPTEMYPGTAQKRFGDRFVVFSGGKLEFRKGQDIVLAAFRRFHRRHPDALLVTAWHNPWPATAAGIAESSLTPVPPKVGADNRLRIIDWAMDNGVPAEGFGDLGFLTRDKIAPVLWECHAAVFPNRCEGATNLVAMEAMACGVPTVLSANTGHMDLIKGDTVFPLEQQTPVHNPDGGRINWGESSVDELVETLERIYTDYEEARRRRAAALAFVHGERTWRKFAESVVATCQQ
jgi:glycosyltransferase involved in cell wall biosynthesis